MKKRLLCALLAAAMCFGETLSASAVTVSTNDVEMEQTGTISENTTEVDAEKEAATIYPDGKVPTKFPKGQGYELKMYVTPDTKYSVAVYDAKNEMVSYTMGFSAKAPFGQDGEVLETVKLEFDKLAVGNYELKYWIGGLDSANASTAQGKTIYVRKSILKKENENITEVTVSKAVYTGKSVKPVVKIVETEGDNTYTLVEGKDFSYEVTSANKKEMGTATVTIIGMNDYMGMMTADFDITPQAPAITGAVCTGFNSARITWNAVANANGYILERKAGTGNFAQVATLASGATSYEDTTGLVTGETYYYRIVAKADSKTNANQYVESERNENGVAVKITPSTPKLISLESTSYNKLKLTWNTVNGATGYLVYQILADGSYKQVKTVAQPATGTQASATMTKLKPGQKYRYTVKAYTLAANSVTKIVSGCDTTGLSAKAKPATPAVISVKAYTRVNGKNVFSGMNRSEKGAKVVRAVPKKPTIKLTQWGRSIDVDINKVAGADGYVIYRKVGNGKYKKIGTIDAKKNADFTTYKDATVSYAKTYSYYVRAYKQTDESRVMSAKSKALTLTTK